MLRLGLGLLVVSAAAVLTAADPPPKAGDKKHPLDGVEGYKRHAIEGFTVLVSKDVLGADTAEFERKPLEVLELELKALSRLMTPRNLDVLRRVLIWVEWDDVETLQNGRDGSALAVYRGGHQLDLWRKGMHPLKAKAVTILRMKGLTQEHQPKTDSGRCVLLHELAHAVHDQLLGSDNPALKAAYRQAMERKLYDKTQYVSTNEAEFFAELTCAYYDQLHHYPRTREELRKHDPATFKYLESVWGVIGKKSAAVPASLASTTGADKFDLGVKRPDVRLGEVVHGPAVSAEELADKVTVLGFWGGNETPVLGKLVALHDELAPYGLRVIAGPGFVTPPDRVKDEMTARDVPFAAVDRMLIPVPGTDMLRSESPPHAMVFDPDGSCVFRGSGHDVLPHARAAVGRHLLAALGRAEYPKPFAPVAEALASGKPLLDVLPRLTPLTGSSDPATAADARALLASLTAPGQEALAQAQKLTKTDPVAAYYLVEKLPATYKGTAVAVKAAPLLTTLKATSAVQAELQAVKLLDQVRKLDAALSGQAGSFNPTDPMFQGRNAATLRQLRSVYEQMNKQHPGAKATGQAAKLCKVYGIE